MILELLTKSKNFPGRLNRKKVKTGKSAQCKFRIEYRAMILYELVIYIPFSKFFSLYYILKYSTPESILFIYAFMKFVVVSFSLVTPQILQK